MFGNCKTTVVAAIAAGLMVGVATGAQAEDVLSIARGKHEITIGTSNDAPLSFVDSKDNSPDGVLPDVLKAAFAKIGVKVEIHVVAMPFSSLIPALTSGRIDMIGDAMYATAARKKIIDCEGQSRQTAQSFRSLRQSGRQLRGDDVYRLAPQGERGLPER
jgi:ABC-type amino acid transport substrate-binding protein